MANDFLSVIEHAYRLESDDEAWLRDVGVALHDQVGAGMGLLGFEYEITPEGRLSIGRCLQHQMPDIAPMMRVGLEQMSPEFVRTSFARCEATTQSQGLVNAKDSDEARMSREAMAATFGWHDVFMLGGVDPSGRGVYLGAWLPKETTLPEGDRESWSRVAVHVVAAHRLRRKVAQIDALLPDAADAVLTPDGRLDHARGDAEEVEARAALRDAVLDVEKARGKLRREEPEKAVDLWKGLVSGRWSLVDHFQSDGKRYMLARRNEVIVSAIESLTDRERQVVGWAALGHNNKLIAYEMGISASTVGVLLHRAGRKLGVEDRAGLIRRYLELVKP